MPQDLESLEAQYQKVKEILHEIEHECRRIERETESEVLEDARKLRFRVEQLEGITAFHQKARLEAEAECNRWQDQCAGLNARVTAAEAQHEIDRQTILQLLRVREEK